MDQANMSTIPHSVSITHGNDDICRSMAVSKPDSYENCMTGFVSDKTNGKPIEGACVKLTDDGFNSINQGYSDSKGYFSIPMGTASSCRILAAKKGYCTYTSDLIDLACIGKKGVDIALSPDEHGGIVLYGNVRDFSGKPAQGARVALSRGDMNMKEETTLTDADGGFLFDGLEPVTYRITCQSQDHETYSRVFQPAGDNPVYVLETIYLKMKEFKGTLFGVITDSGDTPVQNALVVLFSADNVPVQVTRTNEKGVYFFYDQGMGQYKIMAK